MSRRHSGLYDGCAMQLIGAVLPGARRFRHALVRLSPDAKRRQSWLDWYQQHGRNARATCRHFGISPDTLYRWRRRHEPGAPQSLEADSRRPDRGRAPTVRTAALRAQVKALREAYPRWGKEKLVVLLRRAGVTVSVSTVGRLLHDLVARGQLVEPPRLQRARAARRRRPRPWARRARGWLGAQRPGELVQVDTMVAELVPGERRWQFTAWDRVSKWNVVAAYRRPTSRCAADFLEQLRGRMPFPVEAIQVDGGSEFKAVFEAACQAARLPLWVLPPKCPKLNGGAERSHRTHQEEFYEVEEVALTVAAHNAQLRRQEARYNTVRPHQALGQRTPLEFLSRWPGSSARAREVYGMY